MNTITYQNEQEISEGLTDIMEQHQLQELSGAMSTALLARIIQASAPSGGVTSKDLYDTLVSA
ncbi:hypothetical protein [Limnohabitans sp. DM1]|uniref:hypothetical protein n=1 Tax=Limnohabitans sp. DM1 TaxID=1597955 RepID=UPI000AAE0540|nr:hypothetical protein [Limnohabitans sp. DM1]